MEVGESIKEAVLRELFEETTIEMKISKLLYEHHYTNDGDQYFYFCNYVAGKTQLGDGPEKEKMEKGADIYKPGWLEIPKLEKILLYPLEIRDWIIKDHKNGFKDTPRPETLATTSLHQKF